MSRKKIKKRFLKETVTLVIGGFSLVAALAWNDAIQSIFQNLIGGELSQMWAKIIYAIAVTLIAAIIVVQIGKYRKIK